MVKRAALIFATAGLRTQSAPDTLDNFDLMFGVSDDSLVTFLILCCKFYIYRCKFQEVSPNFVAFKRFLLTKRKTEYCIAYKKGKLSNHFKKWAFDI